MNNNAWFKKENPFQTVIGYGGGATGFGAYSSAVSKPYVEDVFSTYVYTGTGSTRSINNSIDLSGKGGMVWIKNRGTTDNNNLFDTVRGATKYLRSNETTGTTTDTGSLSAFNSDGFSVVDGSNANASSNTYSSWSFRKSEGFFDVVNWTGDGTASRTISHSLGCIPGCIMIKAYSHNGLSWAVGHRSLNSGVDPWDYMFNLTADAKANDNEIFNDTAPTSTNFTIGDSNLTNTSGVTYVAYVFAGAASTASTATSVDLDGSGDYLEVDYTTEYQFSSNDFTIEFWARVDTYAAPPDLIDTGDAADANRWRIFVNASGNIVYRANKSSRITSTSAIIPKSWHHYAIARNSGTTTLYIDGRSEGSFSDSINYGPVGSFIGRKYDGSNQLDGAVSNYRLVNGTAVYTTDFIPPIQPLTNITNTKLLCCQGSSATDATVIPSGDSITANGDAAVSTNSPFDDPDAFKFGPDEDKPIIKCGSYIGNGSTVGREILLGWEPQWLLVKNATDASTDWSIIDCMRGIVTGGNDARLRPNKTDAEQTSISWASLTSTGFQPTTANDNINNSNSEYVYIAIRRPDGYVGKPPSAGTDVFAMDTGAGSSTIPNFDSGFPVDFSFFTETNNNVNRLASSRLTQNIKLTLNTTDAEASDSNNVFDSNVGWQSNNGCGSTWQAWMFKRGQGMDVVTYTGDGSWGRGIPHSLNQVPEMMWIKRDSSGEEWIVYHKGLDGGNQPETHYLMLQSDAAEADGDWAWSDTAPTSTHFTVGGGNATNGANASQRAFLFASANNADGDAISKVGSYTGNGNATGPTVTLGFEPRFLLIKGTSSAEHWLVFDTLRGLSSSGTESRLLLNSASPQDATYDYVNTTATGFTIHQTFDSINTNGGNYVYYAHA